MLLCAVALLLDSAAAGGSDCSKWMPSRYDKRDNQSMSGPGDAIREAHCVYGQEAANGECRESGKNQGPVSQECVCMSKESAREAAETHQVMMMGLGGGLLGVGVLMGLTCLGFAGPIERGCMAWNDSQPCKPKWESCRGWNVFWNMAFWPIGLPAERVERVAPFGVPPLVTPLHSNHLA